MANQIVGAATKILDTTSSDTGDTQTFLSNNRDLDKYAYFQVAIGSGDTVVIEGRLESNLSFVVLETITSDTLKLIKLPNEYRARRTVDGGGADSEVWVQTLGSFNGQ